MSTIFDDLERLEHEAGAFGFQWETKAQIMAQIRSECLEIEEHLESPQSRADLQDEIGDLLHAVFSLCVYCNFDPETTLRKSLDKFEHRFNAVKALAEEQGLVDLNGKSFDELMAYWEKAKTKTKIPHSGKVSGTPKALSIWESKVTEKELILSNVWCGKCSTTCTIQAPIATVTGKTIVLNGHCPVCNGPVARYIDE